MLISSDGTNEDIRTIVLREVILKVMGKINHYRAKTKQPHRAGREYLFKDSMTWNWWFVNIGSGDGLVSSDNKKLPEAMLTIAFIDHRWIPLTNE